MSGTNQRERAQPVALRVARWMRWLGTAGGSARAMRITSMSETSKPRKVPGASGSTLARFPVSGTMMPASKRPWMTSNKVARVLVLAGNDNVVVGFVERIEHQIELIGIDVFDLDQGRTTADEVHAAAGDTPHRLFERSIAGDQLGQALAGIDAGLHRDAFALRTPIDQHDVGAGGSQRFGERHRVRAGFHRWRFTRYHGAMTALGWGRSTQPLDDRCQRPGAVFIWFGRNGAFLCGRCLYLGASGLSGGQRRLGARASFLI